MADETLLEISGPGINPWSARGLSQSLVPIPAAQSFRRTMNGSLRDLSLEQFRKYRSTISCTDVSVPALDGVWPGQVLTVYCVAELAYLTSSAGGDRPAVAGSEYTDGDYTFYRPILQMMVVGHQVNFDEYGKQHGWTLELEEV
ncbi:hypothetical protein [Alsobacter sp. R-9]